MSEQVPRTTDTTVRQPVDSEAVSSTANTTGRLGPRVSVHGSLRMRSGYEPNWCGVVFLKIVLQLARAQGHV